jgi:hypothetical protein
MADIDKALRLKILKIEEELKERILAIFYNLLLLFRKVKADKLNPYKPGINYKINIKINEKERPFLLPFGALYNILKDELLVLKKIFRDLLDKRFIKVNSFKGGAPVLFVRKLGGGIRFCVDYRALNNISNPDRYPLPLITDTLRLLTKAKWFIKLDIMQAFYKIRIKEGNKYKITF